MKHISAGEYSVYFESQNFANLNKKLNSSDYDRVFILCDENTLQQCLPLLVSQSPALREAEIIEIEKGEQSKSLEITAMIWQTLLESNAGRQTLLINLGGGVVSDLGGFAASTYKRGIDFINVPTSLLAMADASVGGKTGIDFGGIKNSIGTFNEPIAVYVYSAFLNTLESRHVSNGLSEIYKIALVANSKLWHTISNTKSEDLIHHAIALKAQIVAKDPYEKGLRRVLNFGHTLGHAIEAVALNRAHDVLHGEAVVAGMIMETHLSWQKKKISKKTLDAIVSKLCEVFPPLPVALPDLDDLYPYLQNDKKNKKGEILFSLLKTIGKCETGIACSKIQISKSLDYYKSLYNA